MAKVLGTLKPVEPAEEPDAKVPVRSQGRHLVPAPIRAPEGPPQHTAGGCVPQRALRSRLPRVDADPWRPPVSEAQRPGLLPAGGSRRLGGGDPTHPLHGRVRGEYDLSLSTAAGFRSALRRPRVRPPSCLAVGRGSGAADRMWWCGPLRRLWIQRSALDRLLELPPPRPNRGRTRYQRPNRRARATAASASKASSSSLFMGSSASTYRSAQRIHSASRPSGSSMPSFSAVCRRAPR